MSKEKMVIGVDLSLSSIGVVVRNLKGTKIQAHALIIDPRKKDDLFPTKMDHYDYICKWVMGFVNQCNRQDLQLVAIEGYSLQSSGNAVSKMVENGARLRYLLWDCYIPFIEVAPQTLKAYATGKPSADKQRVRDCMKSSFPDKFVKDLTNYKQKQQEDLIDAYVASEIGTFCVVNQDVCNLKNDIWDDQTKRKMAMCKKIWFDHFYMNRSLPERG